MSAPDALEDRYAVGLAEMGSGVTYLLREAQALADHLVSMPAERWDEPTRAAGWRVHDVVAHVASGELYNEACFDGTIDQVDVYADDEEYNTAHVALRRDWTHEEVHAEWDRRRRRAHRMYADRPPAEVLVGSR